jgi:dUTP pyrophosphatase
MSLSVVRLSHGKHLPLPVYATPGSAGFDLMSALSQPLTLDSGMWRLIPTGLAMAVPVGYEAQIRSRSGLAFKHGIQVLNSPGTIDADYRGEIKVLLMNHGTTPFVVEPGMRIAQMVIAQVPQAVLNEVGTLDTTVRGAGGFGSTGV